MKILLVGVGLIGGSFALALKQRQEVEFGGYSRKKATLAKAEDLGITSRSFENLKEGIDWADWIVLSIPVDVIRRILPEILDQLRQDQLVIDFGSTKEAICEAVNAHPRRSRFIAAHPIAGTEYSGPEAAFKELFQGKLLIICEEEKVDRSALEVFEEMAIAIGFNIARMGAAEHDRHLAYISHLSHVTSYALSNAVLEKEEDGDVILDLAGSGFASTVRLAKSSPEMWVPIFMENRKMILEGIEQYLNKVEEFRNYLKRGDEEAMKKYLENGRKIRKIIP